jgi:hypothetical protein
MSGYGGTTIYLRSSPAWDIWVVTVATFTPVVEQVSSHTYQVAFMDSWITS